MNFLKKYTADIKALSLSLFVFFAARASFILLMPKTYSKDLYGWLLAIDILGKSGNPYRDADVLNYPPFWMQILYCIHFVSKHTSISDTHLIQLTLILSEAMVLILSYIIIKKYFFRPNLLPLLILGFALNPISILLNCQHCNFDIIIAFWILLFIYMLLDFYHSRSPVSWLLACFFIGMGILTKTIPLVLAPLLSIGTITLSSRTKIFGFILVFMPIFIGMSIIFSLAPHQVTENVLKYRSIGGYYGISGILGILNSDNIPRIYTMLYPICMLSLLTFLFWRGAQLTALKPQQLISLILFLLISIPTFGPGFSPTYLSWFLAISLMFFLISTTRVRRFLILAYVLISIDYITEYAFFDSHGAFMTKIFPTQKMLALSNWLGGATMQTIIRLPMFICFLVLFVLLFKDLVKTYSGTGLKPLHN